jgi:putative ABC transport system permease protein
MGRSALKESTINDVDNKSYFTIRGINYAPVQAIEEGRLCLRDGRVFTSEEVRNASEVMLVSDRFAELNNIHVGDTIELMNEVYNLSNSDQPQGVMDKDSIALKVIGIFSLKGSLELNEVSDGKINIGDVDRNEGIKSSDTLLANELYNTFYVPFGVSLAADKFIKDSFFAHQLDYAQKIYFTPVYVLESSDDIETFTKAVEDVLPEFYTITSTQSHYEKIAEPLLGAMKMTEFSLAIFILAGGGVLSLISVALLRERRHEFGIYYALGERRATLVYQAIIEMMLVFIVGIALSAFTGLLLSDKAAEFLLSERIVEKSSIATISATESVGLAFEQSMLVGSQDSINIAFGYNGGISVEYAVIFFLLSASILLFACSMPILYMLRLKPRKILE